MVSMMVAGGDSEALSNVAGESPNRRCLFPNGVSLAENMDVEDTIYVDVGAIRAVLAAAVCRLTQLRDYNSLMANASNTCLHSSRRQDVRVLLVAVHMASSFD